MKMFRCFCIATMACGLAAADIVTHTANDIGTFSSFTDGSHWSDLLVPHSGADYVTTGGSDYTLRTPASGDSITYTFGGDSLTIGDLSTTGGWFTFKSYGPCIVNIPDLRLAKGGCGQGTGNSTATLKGGITVTATESSPFEWMGNDLTRSFSVQSTFAGAAGTAMTVDRVNMLCYGNATAYYGKWIVNGRTDKSAVLAFASGTCVCGDREELLPDAITLMNNATLSVRAAYVTLGPANSGLYIASTGGRLRADPSATFVLAMPTTGSGDVEKYGTGALVISNSWAETGALTVTEGRCGFASNAVLTASASPSISVKSGAEFGISQDQIGSRALTFETGSFLNPAGLGTIGELSIGTGSGATQVAGVSADYAADSCDCVHLTAGATVAAWPMPIRLTSCPLVGSATRYAVLTIPTSLYTVTPESFTNTTATQLGLPSMSVEVETDGNGLQTVYIHKLNTVVRLITTESMGSSWLTAKTWSDGLAAHAGADYIINSAIQLRTPENATMSYTFPGDSLACSLGEITLKCLSATFNDIRLYNNSTLGGGGSANPQTLYGKVTSMANVHNEIRSDVNRVFIIAAELAGLGEFEIKPTVDEGYANVELTGLNTNYLGRMLVSGRLSGWCSAVSIWDERNLGGSSAAFNAATLVIQSNALLRARQTLTIDDPNRGITIGLGKGRIEVADSAVLTIREPVVYKSSLTKSGAGLLALGGTATANGNTLEISAGAFQPLSGDVIGNGCLLFDAGTALVLAVSPENATLAESGIVGANDTAIRLGGTDLPVAIDIGATAPAGSFTVPICTVSESNAAALRGNFSAVTELTGFSASVIEESAGTQVRFSLRYKNISGTIFTLH